MNSTITAERVLTPDGWRDHAAVTVGDGRILAVRPLASGERADHAIVAPGFVDIQVNGIDDVDVGAADGDDWDRIDALLAAQGTTTWCPTLVTRDLEHYPAAFDRIERAMQRRGVRPQIAGVHLEGPFLGRAHGAHPSRFVADIDPDFIARLPSSVRIVTLGAEVPGAVDAPRTLTGNGVVVAVGHSEPSDIEMGAVVDAGARLVTHLFNAMSGVHHRHDGLALVALTDERLTFSMIADGVHLSERVMSLVWRARADAVVLVTDSVAWGATDRVTIVDGAPRLGDGTLAGSCLTMDRAVRNSVAAGADLDAALVAASTRPAHLLGLHDRGAITAGRRADLVALDAERHVTTTWVEGVELHRRPIASPR